VHQARSLLQQLIQDPRETGNIRITRLRALARLDESLGNTFAPSDWYASVIPTCGHRNEFMPVFGSYFAARRGPALHLAGAHQAWRDIDAGKIKFHPKTKRDYDWQKREWFKSFNNVVKLTKRHEFGIKLFPEPKK
jgi:hypothetical protein